MSKLLYLWPVLVFFPGGVKQDHPHSDKDLLMIIIHRQPIYLYCLKTISLLGFSPLSSLSISSPLPKKGFESLTPTTQGVAGRPAGDGYQLLVAVVGSVTVTCVTILLALLALFFIRKTLLNRRRTFTYQSGSVRVCFGKILH